MAVSVASAHLAPAPDAPALPLEGIDVPALARRAAVPAALAAAAAAALVVAGGPLHAFLDAIDRAVQADPRWVIAAGVFELLSFVGYIGLFWMVGSRATSRLGVRASAYITLGGAGATRLLPTAGVGGAALTLWSLRRAGLGTRGATSTLLSFLVLQYAVFLGALVVAGGSSPSASRATRPSASARCRPARRRSRSPPRSSSRPGAPRRRRSSPPTPPAPPGSAAACARRVASSAPACATASPSCGPATCACSAPPPTGPSTRPSSGRCSRRSARPPRSPSSSWPTSSARSATPCPSRAP